MRCTFTLTAFACAVAHFVMLSTAALASVPGLGPPQWEEIDKTLKDTNLPLGWTDTRGNSLVYYQLHFGTELKAIALLQQARSSGIKIRDLESLAYFAATNGKEAILRTLIASGISPNAKFNRGSLLMAAAREGQLGTMRVLIESGADINYRWVADREPERWSDAAITAFAAGQYNAGRLLISAGYVFPKNADLQARKLFFAAITGRSATAVRYMLDNFNLIDTQTVDGETPLTLAVLTETSDDVVAELLLRGADPCKRNKDNESVALLLKKLNEGRPSYETKYLSLQKLAPCQRRTAKAIGKY